MALQFHMLAKLSAVLMNVSAAWFAVNTVCGLPIVKASNGKVKGFKSML